MFWRSEISPGRKAWKNKTLLQRFMQEEDALGTVELILIIVVLVGLVAIFKKQLVSLVNNILAKITKQSNSI